MKYKKYRLWELDFLKDNYKTMAAKELSYHLKRSVNTIRHKAMDLNISLKYKPWSKEEIKFLLENFHKLPTDEIKIKLNRSKSSLDRILYLNKMSTSKRTSCIKCIHHLNPKWPIRSQLTCEECRKNLNIKYSKLPTLYKRIISEVSLSSSVE